MYLGWYDPTTKIGRKPVPAADKVIAAASRYAEKFGAVPETVLCNPIDAAELGDALAFTLETGEDVALSVSARGFIPRHTFYVGCEDGE